MSEETDRLTRTFLSAPAREVHRILRGWMEDAGMLVELDAAGNLRGTYTGRQPHSPRLLIGSHVDTVPGAGAFDGVLGVVIAIALVDALFGVEVPMDAQVNSALCVGPFRVAKRFERGWPEGHDVALNIPILAVEFIRNKSKSRFVGPKMTQGTRHRRMLRGRMYRRETAA